MSKYEYELQNGKLIPTNTDIPTQVLDLKNEYPELTMYYQSLCAHNRDLDYAKEYLKQMFFKSGTTLIDGALINSAIQLLIKCFSSPKKSGRKKLDSYKVFSKYAPSHGFEDMSAQFQKFYDARNNVLAHDQSDHKENIVAISVNAITGECIDVTNLTIRTNYLYKQNKDILMKLIDIAKSYVEKQCLDVETKIIERYNSASSKPDLIEVFTDIPQVSHW
ncbi:MAG: hypothetical protein IKM66_00825 [Clostridia bacterium]|nr:hypothetical protein [Clostridia bacterium]